MGPFHFAAITLALTVGAAESSGSSELAKQLATMLSSQGLDAVAAADPADPARFIAALFLPDSQLLVVAGPSSSPASEQARIANKQYRDIYLDLQGGAAANGRVFYQDMKADGLCSTPEQIPDIVYRGSLSPMVIDGRAKGHEMSEKEYEAQRVAAEKEYGQLLQILLGQLKGT